MAKYLYTVPYEMRTGNDKYGLIVAARNKEAAYNRAERENPTDQGLVKHQVRRATAEDIAMSDINVNWDSADYETFQNAMISTEDGAVQLGE
jgi:hypothetical protein